MNAAGITITTPDGLALFLKRGAIGDHAGTWAWPGGGIEDGETPEEAARREALEEIGYSPEGDLSELDHEEDEQGAFTTFHHSVPEHFLPKLNSEHTAYAWAPLTDPPVPLHPGVAETLEKLRQTDIALDDWKESDHPRGQPGNSGQFGSGGGSEMPDLPDFLKKEKQSFKMPQFGLTRPPSQFISKPRPPAPVSSGEPKEASSTVVFESGKKSNVKSLNGVKFKSYDPPDDWADVEGQVNIDEPELPELKKGQSLSSGCIIQEPDGRVWILRSSKGFGGYDQTFPKGGVEDGLSPQANAIKEVFEETGLKVRITGFSGDHEGDTSVTRFYTAVREGGNPTDAGPESEGVILAPVDALEKMLNRRRDKEIAKSLKPGPESIDVKSLEKKSGKLGSNEGGVYLDKDGNKFYVKKPKTKEHVENEKAAARLYQLAGVNTLDYVDAGPDHVATKWEKLDKNNISDFTSEEKKEAAKDFAVHAWLSNWDAAGLGGDNQGIKNGKPTTLDVGGSLRYRAQGGPKGNAFGDKVTEMSTLRDKKMNPDAANLFGSMSDDDVKDSVKRVGDIPNTKIREAVGDDKELADRLIARKNDMMKQVGLSGTSKDSYAFDRASVRRTDVDGRLHVETSNISKANVCPYLGREIPNFQELGLNPDKIYRLYRDPEELERAAPTFNNLPVLSKHVEVNAADHRPDLLIGTTGSEAEFAHPYLRNSLAVWTQEAINDIEDERKKELSSAYRYRADMKPGTSPEGEDYDGVMRDIVGNHVALVEEGRAGPDVVVGDSKEELNKMKTLAVSQKAMMARGAIAAFLIPRLAADAKMPSLTSILLGVNAKNFAEKKPVIVAAINRATKGVLAKDASTEGLLSLLDGLEKAPAVDEGDPLDDVDLAPTPEPGKELADPDVKPLQPPNPMDAVKAFLEGKLSPEDMAEVEKLCTGGATDDPPPFEGMPKPGGEMIGNDADEDDDMKFNKPAMDAAIAKAKADAVAEVTKNNREIRDAERTVRPYVGEVTKAFDSAADVYKSTLEALKVDVVGVDPSAYPAMLRLIPVPGTKIPSVPEFGMDAATTADFEKRFPNAARIGHI